MYVAANAYGTSVDDQAVQAEMSVAPDVASIHLLFVLIPICISIVVILLIILIVVYIRYQYHQYWRHPTHHPSSSSISGIRIIGISVLASFLQCLRGLDGCWNNNEE